MNAWYPSRRAVFAVALGIPLSLLAALAAPAFWAAGLYWSAAVAALVLLDLLLGARPRSLEIAPHIPAQAGVGRPLRADFALSFTARAPQAAEVELESNDRFTVTPRRRDCAPGDGASFELTPLRRGAGRLERLWLRWTGPLGLAWI